MQQMTALVRYCRIGLAALLVLLLVVVGPVVSAFAAERASGAATSRSPRTAVTGKKTGNSSSSSRRQTAKKTKIRSGKQASKKVAAPTGKRAVKQPASSASGQVKKASTRSVAKVSEAPSKATGAQGKSGKESVVPSIRESSEKQAALPASGAEKAVPAPSRKKVSRTGLRAFTPKAFGKKVVKPARNSTRKRASYDVRSPDADVRPLDTPLSVVEGRRIPDDPLTPRHTAVFPGDRHTLSQMEKEPQEMGVRYRLNDTASARLNVNSQDPRSPIYTPLKKDEDVSATGVYLDLKMSERLLFQIGGEYRSLEGSRPDVPEQGAAGASMGLNWEF